MKLRTYLAENDITLKEFSQKINCAYYYLSAISHGKRIPGKRLVKDIQEATGGEVSMTEEISLANQREFLKPLK
jgi:hypothetical protein